MIVISDGFFEAACPTVLTRSSNKPSEDFGRKEDKMDDY